MQCIRNVPILPKQSAVLENIPTHLLIIFK